MIRVLLVLKDPLLRLGIESALRIEGDFEVVGASDDLPAAEALLRTTHADVVILDKVLQPKQSMCAFRDSFPQTHVLVYVPHGVDDCVLRSALHADQQVFPRDALQKLDCCLVSLKSCARGCVPKDATARQLATSIRAVVAGELAAGPWLSAHFEEAPRNLGAITYRELEIMRLVAGGLSNKAIARKLAVREQTVKNHVARIARKLGRRTRLELALFAIRHRITEN